MKERLKSLLRPTYHWVKSVGLYPYSRRVVSNYAKHYQESRRLFEAERDGRSGPPPLSELRARVLRPNGRDGLIGLPPNYTDLVGRIAKDVAAKFQVARNCRFFPQLFPKIEPSNLPERTDEIPAVRNGEAITAQLKTWLEIDRLDELCAALLPSLEEKVFGSHLLLEKIYIYRSLMSRLEGQVSWTWHYDNHPKEIRKLMIYLTDVDEDSGPLTYLRSTRTGEPRWMVARPLLGYSRVSEKMIRSFLDSGDEPTPVTGPAGTLILFEENIVHRAIVAKKRVRDVLVLQIRPCTTRPERVIDPRSTGSFEHRDFNPNPWDTRTWPKKKMLSA